MKRTQIYLRESQKDELDKLAAQTGKALAELVREAVDNYIAEKKITTENVLEQTSGLWKDRDDINSGEYLDRLRSDMDKRLEGNNK